MLLLFQMPRSYKKVFSSKKQRYNAFSEDMAQAEAAVKAAMSLKWSLNPMLPFTKRCSNVKKHLLCVEWDEIGFMLWANCI